MWWRRVMTEFKTAEVSQCRTWMVTFTCSPDYLYKVVCECDRMQGLKGSNFAALTADQQFRLKDRVIYRDVQKFFKRLRRGRGKVGTKDSAPPAHFVHCIVTEAHQSGEPHYHCLIHEVYAYLPVLWRHMEGAAWIGGFYKINLVRDNPAYAVKYLTKEGGHSRVRASKGYGSPFKRSVNIVKRGSMTPPTNSKMEGVTGEATSPEGSDLAEPR